MKALALENTERSDREDVNAAGKLLKITGISRYCLETELP